MDTTTPKEILQLYRDGVAASSVSFFEEKAFRQVFKDLKSKGKKFSPRGLEVIEIENYTYELPPYARFCNFAARKLNLDYIKREFLWYLKGDKYDLSILKHAKMWEGLVNADGSINSNYGQYIFHRDRENGVFNSLFDYVTEELMRDKDSRRASMVILRKEHLLSQTKDYPCTYSLNFRIRGGALNMSVHMRSQDAVFGMGNDAPCFSFIHELVYQTLKSIHYPELQLGTYHHIADSFHVYARHYEVMEAIAEGSVFMPIIAPQISASETSQLINHPESPNAEDSPFHNWLFTYDKKETT